MNFLRRHWYDLGGVLAIPLGLSLWVMHRDLNGFRLVLWLNLLALLLHQLEEYRLIGTFPGMINSWVYRSPQPDRFPLNPQTSLIINVGIGWTVYLLAAILAERAVWLGIAAILVSAGNVLAHTLLFNIRGRRFFNAGILSALLLFLPLVIWFFYALRAGGTASAADWVAGIGAGALLNVVGVLKMIDWLADPQTPHVFEQRQLLPSDRD